MTHTDMITAKDILLQNGYTCILYADGQEYHSRLRGVKPLIEFLQSDKDFSGFCAADKTVGAGAAHLYVLLGVRAVWANVMSEDAKNILQQHHIAAYCEQTVPFIINRAGDAPCPVETAVKGITDSKQALVTIVQTLRNLKMKTDGCY